MRFSRKFVIAAIFFAVILYPAYFRIAEAEDASAQVPPADTAAPSGLTGDVIPGGMNGRVSLDLRNIDIVDALKFLAVKAGANIIATKNVAGRVTLMVDNVPVRDIFDIMLRSNGLAYAKQGDIYNVMTEEEYKAIFGKKFSDIREVKVFKLKYAIPDQAFSMLDALKSDIGRVLVEPDSGTALIMDTPERIRDIETALSTLEKKNLVRVFTLKYAKAKEVEEQLKAQLDAKKVGTVKADERSNQIIIQALPNRMPDIEKIIRALDGKTKEVLIDTKIIKIELSDQLTQGIDWEGLLSAGVNAGMIYLGSTPFSVVQTATTAAATAFPSRWNFFNSTQNTQGVGAGMPFSGNAVSDIATPAGSGAVSPGEVMHVGLINKKSDIDVMVKYMQTLGNTQVLSSPKLAVINNQEARIHIGQRQAYVTTTTTTGQTTTTVSEEVTFVDVGIQLAVTPTINNEGFITMKIKPEVSSVVSTLITPSKNAIPIIDTSMAETTVMVKDGTTIIIGGLRKEEKTSAYDQLPFLGKIPILGFFFKSGNGKTVRSELLIMITPHIVGGDMLTTGNEMDFGYKPARNYKKYKDFTEEPDLLHSEKTPAEAIKPYREYSNRPGAEDAETGEPNIKSEGRTKDDE